MLNSIKNFVTIKYLTAIHHIYLNWVLMMIDLIFLYINTLKKNLKINNNKKYIFK